MSHAIAFGASVFSWRVSVRHSLRLSLLLCASLFASCQFIMTGSILALDAEMDVVVDAVSRSASRVVHSAELRFQLNVQDQIPSDAEIQSVVNSMKDATRELISKNSDNPGLVEELQKSIDIADQVVPPQLIHNATLQFRCYFASSGPELGGDRYYEFSQLNRVKEEYGTARSLLLRSNGSPSGLGIDYDPMAEGVCLVGRGRKDVFLPAREPHLLGRINGGLEVTTRNLSPDGIQDWLQKNISKSESRVSKDLDGAERVQLLLHINSAQPRIEMQDTNKSLQTIELHVVPSKGYITPLIRESDPEGRVVLEWKCEDYFLVPGSDLWFPGRCETRRLVPGQNDPHVERYEFDKATAFLNQRISDERFAVRLPARTSILDTLHNGRNYVSTAQISLTADNVTELSAIEGVEVAPAPVETAKGRLPDQPSLLRVLFVFVNLIGTTCLAYFLWKRGHSRDATGD